MCQQCYDECYEQRYDSQLGGPHILTQQYITTRKGSPYLHLRVLIPKALQSSIGKKEVLRSLKTEDPVLAEQRATKIRAELYAEWNPTTLPAGVEVSPVDKRTVRPDISAMVREASQAGYELFSKKIMAVRIKKAGESPAEFAAYKSEHVKLADEEAQQFAAMNLNKWKPVADRIIQLRSWDLQIDDPYYDEFVRLIAEAYLDARRSGLELDKGLPAPQPTAPVVIAARKLLSETARVGETMMELFELYASQRVKEGIKRPSCIPQDRMVVGLFSSFVGAERSVSSITTAEAREFRNMLDRLPRNASKRKEFAGLPFKEIVAKASATTHKMLNPKTQARYLSTLSPFFRWLRSEAYVESQPFDGLHLHVTKRGNPRPPFSIGQFNVLLNSPLYAGFEQTGKEHLPGGIKADDWRHWFPLICMLTGARAAEVAQLRVANIYQEFGVWVINITDDDRTNERTKNGESRVIAVHSKLFELGFLDFCKQQVTRSANDNCPFLFPDLVVGSDEAFGARPSRWFRDYLVRIGIKNKDEEDGDGLGAHSFRHAMTDELRKADYSNEEIGAKVLGHSNNSVTSGYGVIREGTATKLKEIIDAAKFEGVDFTHVYR